MSLLQTGGPGRLRDLQLGGKGLAVWLARMALDGVVHVALASALVEFSPSAAPILWPAKARPAHAAQPTSQPPPAHAAPRWHIALLAAAPAPTLYASTSQKVQLCYQSIQS